MYHQILNLIPRNHNDAKLTHRSHLFPTSTYLPCMDVSPYLASHFKDGNTLLMT